MAWRAFDDGRTIGSSGSEQGVIVRDDEHDDGARITLERDCAIAPYAITSGIYGWMVHTCFFSRRAEAEQAYDEMQAALGRIVDALPRLGDPDARNKSYEASVAMAAFAERYP